MVVAAAVLTVNGLHAVVAESYRFSIEAPATFVSEPGRSETFDATCRLQIEDGVPTIQAWSIGVTSGELCTIVAATTDGTVAATRENGGLRDRFSFETTEVIDPEKNGGQQGAVSYVVLTFSLENTLAAAGSPYDVLKLTLKADVSDCLEGPSECAIRYVDGLRGSGLPVRNTVVQYTPEAARDAVPEVSQTTVSLAAPAPCAVQSGHWSFDDGAGITASDAVGANDGQLINMDENAWRGGVVGTGALEFDGIDDYVGIPTPECFDFLQDFSWAVWLRTSRDGPNGAILSKSPVEAGWTLGSKALSIGSSGDRDDGRLTFDVGGIGFVSSDLRVDDQEWHHVVLTVDFDVNGPRDEATLYVDGESLGARDDWDLNTQPDCGELKVGFASPDFPVGGAYFSGFVDDVRIFGSALSAGEVTELFEAVPRPLRFLRADANGDGLRDVSDAVLILRYLFESLRPPCLDALDTDDDGVVDLEDALGILTLVFEFDRAFRPPVPFLDCGHDPTGDSLGCDSFRACE